MTMPAVLEQHEAPGPQAVGATGRPVRINGALVAGASILILMLIASFIVPAVWHQGPRFANPIAFSQSPSWAHPFGTDSQGFDVFVRVFYAPRIDLTIAVAGVAIGTILGVALGVAAGYARGFIGSLTLRLADIIQAFPLLILALTLVTLAGNGSINIVWALVFINTPIMLRLTRTSVLAIREQRYIDAAIALGNPRRRVLFKHVLPNAIGPVIVQAGVNAGYAIILIAALAFLGVGIQVPTPEWGSMILLGSQDITTGQWWTALFPGLALALAVVGFNLLADGVERAREIHR
jgi:peptide/nickel transport system permease protein